jgi:hypothetical protein
MRQRKRSGHWSRRLRCALARTAAKLTPPYPAELGAILGWIEAQALERPGNTKLPQLSLRKFRYVWLRGPATISNCYFRLSRRTRRQKLNVFDLARPREERPFSNFSSLSRSLGKVRLAVLQGVSEWTPKPP